MLSPSPRFSSPAPLHLYRRSADRARASAARPFRRCRRPAPACCRDGIGAHAGAHQSPARSHSRRRLQSRRHAARARRAACAARDSILIDRPGLGWSLRRGAAAVRRLIRPNAARLLDRLGISSAPLSLAIPGAGRWPCVSRSIIRIAWQVSSRWRRRSILFRAIDRSMRLALPILGRLLRIRWRCPWACRSSAWFLRRSFRNCRRGHYSSAPAALLSLRPRVFLANARDIAGLRKISCPRSRARRHSLCRGPDDRRSRHGRAAAVIRWRLRPPSRAKSWCCPASATCCITWRRRSDRGNREVKKLRADPSLLFAGPPRRHRQRA